jgi:hypothetical protein
MQESGLAAGIATVPKMAKPNYVDVSSGLILGKLAD